MGFGSTLRLLRQESGLSQRALASEIGVSVAYLSRVENGHDPPPTPDRLRGIALAMGLPAEALFDLVDDLRPDALAWLGAQASGRRLAAELARRNLGPAQLSLVIDFVERSFPEGKHRVAPAIGPLLSPERVLLQVRVARAVDALELAALRLVGAGAAAAQVARWQAAGRQGLCGLGGGLWIAHGGPAPTPVAALLLLESPVSLDDAPMTALLALAGLGSGRSSITTLARAARLAREPVVSALRAAWTPDEVLARVAELERGGWPG